MGLWRGKVIAEGSKMVAIVEFNLPIQNKSGRWYGYGLSEKSWGHLAKSNFVETNIGRIKILKQTPEPTGLVSIAFHGSGAPKGFLAKQVKMFK
jgi:hypothetical protein